MNTTPAINGKLAIEEDAMKGIAVYYIGDAGREHKIFNEQLPKLAYLLAEENTEKELVIVIQMEFLEEETVIGYRNIDGGNGVCYLYEIEFIDNEATEKYLLRSVLYLYEYLTKYNITRRR